MTPNPDAQENDVPPAFEKVVAQFAQSVGVEADPLIQGKWLEYSGRRFWLVHYGLDDPQGLTILMEAAALPEEPGALVALTTPLLEYHVAVPVALQGYYGCLPDHNCLVHCTRLALDELADPAATLEATIWELADSMGSAHAHIASAGAEAKASQPGSQA
ncbi:MAG: hypothetical protein EOO28_11055 [Comamonadaceae bacterium]|nr:MAG: hypothetical protein EOO28_11055 [Comamonadaceae bacterium]